MSIVNKLVEQGYTVDVVHYRYYWMLTKRDTFPYIVMLTKAQARKEKMTDYAIPKIGKTTIIVSNGEDDPIYTATSVCQDEPYVKKVGVQMAYKALCKKYPNVFKEIEENVCS